MTTPPQDVVILAAGNGLRLSSLSPVPKPLVTVGGRPLLDRLLLTLLQAQISRVCIVLGHAATAIRHYPFAAMAHLDVRWVHNPDFRRPNGLSLLRAEGHVQPPFLLLMADHLFEASTLQRFMQQPCPPGGALLAVDRHPARIFDLNDATKVESELGIVRAIGKDLERYEAVDTGMFLCSAGVFDAMRASVAAGGESLTAGIKTLASSGRVTTWDIGDGRWIDVDTPAARDEAERLVRAGFFHTPNPRRPSVVRPLGAMPLQPDAPWSSRQSDVGPLPQLATCSVAVADRERD